MNLLNQYWKSKDQSIDEELANQLVLKGKYQLAIVIPQDLTKSLNSMVAQNVADILSEFGLVEDTSAKIVMNSVSKIEVKLCFDPASNLAFKNGVKSAIENLVAKLETQTIYRMFQKELDLDQEGMIDSSQLIRFLEISPRLAIKLTSNPTQPSTMYPPGHYLLYFLS